MLHSFSLPPGTSWTEWSLLASCGCLQIAEILTDDLDLLAYGAPHILHTAANQRMDRVVLDTAATALCLPIDAEL